METNDAIGQGTRAARRRARRGAHSVTRARARLRKGQTLIIFALSFTVLLGLAGLAIDVARAYDLYAKMQRAAEAGAIAGVLYMPSYYNSARIPGDGLSAVSRASVEMVKDGFGTALPVTMNDCPTPTTSIEVAICPVSGAQTDLEVFITEHLNVMLLNGLGISGMTLQVKAQAEYIPPVQIGSRENYFGDQVECSSGSSSNTNTSACSPGASGSHLQYFMATMNGPAELKESGDPYVYCAEGDAESTPDSTSLTQMYTYNGYPTDHQQWSNVSTGTSNWTGIGQYCGKPVPGGNHGNTDYQPDGYTGAATANGTHPGGYTYYIGVNSGVGNVSVWIYNPYYIPQDTINSSCTANLTQLDHFVDDSGPSSFCTSASSNFYQGPMGEGLGKNNPFDGVHHDAPLFFYNVTYTLYQVGNLYDRTSDQQVAVETFPPYDGTTADLSAHGCKTDGTQVYNPYWNAGSTVNTYFQPSSIVSGKGCQSSTSLATSVCAGDGQWCQLMNCGAAFATLSTSNCKAITLPDSSAYRLVVEATGLTANATLNGTTYYNSGPQDGWGVYTYAVKVCQGTPSTPVNCANGDGSNGAGGFNNTKLDLYAWNNADVTFQQSLSKQNANANFPQTSCVTTNQYSYACMDLGCLTSAYAGRTVTARLYDPGDGSGGDLYIGVAAPYANSATITYASSASNYLANYDGDQVVHTLVSATGYRPFNAQWLDVTIKLASNYQGDCFSTGSKSGKSGWFQIVYVSPNGGNPTDTLAVEFTLVGSPDHLVPAL